MEKLRIGTDCRKSSNGTSKNLRPTALGGERRVGEGKNERKHQRDEHSQAGARRVADEGRRGERNRRRLQVRERAGEPTRGLGEVDEEGEYQNEGEHVPAAGDVPLAQYGDWQPTEEHSAEFARMR